ncbi:MAG: hypothetical protein Q4B26_04925 [Eubacteriales bacterium]|nr:hypothetical protein [Eubacteriales bacterium]
MEKKFKDTWNEMSRREKISWLWTYYKIPALAVVGVIGIGVYSATSMNNGQQVTAYEAYFVNTGAGEGVEEQMTEEFRNFAEISEQEKTVLNLSLSLQPGSTLSDFDRAASDQITVEEERKELDILVADAWNFNYLTSLAMISDLRDVLTEEELSEVSEDLFYIDLAVLKEEQQKQREDSNYFGPSVTKEDALASEERGSFKLPDPEQMEEPVPVGIRITEYAEVEKHELYKETEAILGFAQGSEKKELGMQFLNYLRDGIH